MRLVCVILCVSLLLRSRLALSYNLYMRDANFLRSLSPLDTQTRGTAPPRRTAPAPWVPLIAGASITPALTCCLMLVIRTQYGMKRPQSRQEADTRLVHGPMAVECCGRQILRMVIYQRAVVRLLSNHRNGSCRQYPLPIPLDRPIMSMSICPRSVGSLPRAHGKQPLHHC